MTPADAGAGSPRGGAAPAGASLRGAVVFDRDGTLHRDVGYAHRPDQIVWSPGALEALAAVRSAGLLAFVATNQSGVGRGFYGEDDVRALHLWMAGEIRRAGGEIADFVYCPHHPQAAVETYRRACARRKPGPGLILDLLHRFPVDPARCVMIGDAESDKRAAEAAGVGFRLYAGGSLLDLVRPLLPVLADGGQASGSRT